MPHFGEEIIMAKRKPDPSLAGQLDMFGGLSTISNEPMTLPSVPAPEPEPTEVANDLVIMLETAANDGLHENAESAIDQVPIETPLRSQPVMSTIKLSNGWENDEWWTTAMVCAYLKLGRKAIWERTRHPTIGFPQPTHFGSCRHRWRAGEVKAWADLQ
jgi:predicted DNA-binding transcriptional regulator AlpA